MLKWEEQFRKTQKQNAVNLKPQFIGWPLQAAWDKHVKIELNIAVCIALEENTSDYDGANTTMASKQYRTHDSNDVELASVQIPNSNSFPSYCKSRNDE